MDAAELRRQFEALRIRRVKLGCFDIDGALRGKYISLDKFHAAMDGGMGFCDVVFGWDIGDALYDNTRFTGWHTGYPDGHCRIDLDTFRSIPWEPATAFFLLDFEAAVSPRRVCRLVMERARELGFTPWFSAEYEFFVFRETPESLRAKHFRDLATLSPGMFGYSVLRASQNGEFAVRLQEDLAAFGVPVEGLHTETGPGVYEAAIAVAEGLAAADRAGLFKIATKEIAARLGLIPTFMAKWNADLPGSSGHLHQSLWRDEKNLFADGVQGLMGSYIAGLVAFLPELMAVFCPTINSYKRTVPGAWAPVNATWGVDNRTTAIRAIPGSAKSSRVELRLTGADINPHIGMAAALAAGLEGIERKLQPPAPTVNAYESGGAPLPAICLKPRACFAIRPSRASGWATLSSSITRPRANGKCGNARRPLQTGNWRGILKPSDMLSTFSFPTKIHFGSGALARLPEELRIRKIKKPLLVTDRGLEKTPVFEQVHELAPNAVVFAAVDPNPVEKNVLDGVLAYRQNDCDGIVGVGGGSPLDAAKAIRLKVTHDLALAEYDDVIDGGAKIGPNLPPFIAIATTSGTGSEVSRSAVITLAATNRKTVIFSPYLIPTVAIEDPGLTMEMPAHLTAGAGMDAFTHNVEAWLAKGYHPMCDAIALAGAKLAWENLPRAVSEPSNGEARSNMMMASMMGAVAFQKGLGAVHSLAHPLSTDCGMHHGTTNAVLLPVVLEYNRGAAGERIARLESEFGGGEAAELVRDLNRRIGIAPRLRDYGVTEAILPKLADKAVQDGCHQLNPRPCTREDLLTLYHEAW